MKNILYVFLLTLGLIFANGCEKESKISNIPKTTSENPAKKPEPIKKNKNKESENPVKKDEIKKEEGQNDIKIIRPSQILTEFIKKEAFNAENPWLVAQGMKAFGVDYKMKSGETVVEFLLKFLEEVKIKGEKYLKFRTGDYYDMLTDANPNMILKILIDLDADLNKKYETKFGTITLRMLIHDAMMLLQPDTLDNVEYPNLDWTIEILVNYLDPEKARWINAYGEPVDLKKIIVQNFKILKKHMRSIEQHYKNNIRRLSKLSKIHSDINGGAHLFWSTAKAIEKGFGDAETLTELREQAELVFYRLKYEPFAYEAMHQDAKAENISDSERKKRLWAFYRDMLKFYAYQLESAQIIQKLHLITIDEARQSILDNAYENLEKLIILLYTEETYKWIHVWNTKHDEKNAKKHIVYHDIVADSCQALRVLNRK